MLKTDADVGDDLREFTSPLVADAAGDGDESDGPGASFSGAVFNVSTSVVGAGIVSLPAAMRVLGVVPALLLIAVGATVAFVAVQFMLRHTDWEHRPASYAELMRAAFGPAGAVVLNLAIVLNTVGTLVVYLIILADVVSGSGSTGEWHAGVLEEWFGSHWWTRREVVLLAVTVAVLLPLALFRRVDSLRHSSALSILLAVVFMLITIGMSVFSLLKGAVQMPRLFPDIAQLSSFELFTAVPVITVAFTFHFNVHPIRSEMRTNKEMATATQYSLVLCSLIYVAIGFFGYLLFGDDTKEDVLANFDNSSGVIGIPQIVSDAARVSYVLHLVLVFPLLLFPLRVNVDELLFRSHRPLSGDVVRFFVLTAGLLTVIYVAAVAIPNIWTLFQLYGSTAAVCISMIFPGAIVLRDRGSTTGEKMLASAMIVLAVVTSTIATAHNISSLLQGKS